MTQSTETSSAAPDPATAGFLHQRRAIAHRLFNDASYPATAAMAEMGALTEAYIGVLLPVLPGQAVWVGGSLGRREMLPNSDLDLFTVTTEGPPDTSPIPCVAGFDQFEAGRTTLTRLSELAERTLIDLNQFVDGRALRQTAAGTDVAAVLNRANSYDRQHANLVVEHFYYRHYDFLDKQTRHGPNMKYSSGSARVVLFFNFLARIANGVMPASRGTTPEFLDGVAAAEQSYGLAGPYRALDLVQVVKNAAISTFEATGDVRQRYVSPGSLRQIYGLCEQRLRSLGCTDAASFVNAYASARGEVEAAVDMVVEQTLRGHRATPLLADLVDSSTDALPESTGLAADDFPHDAATVLALGAWTLVTRPDVSRRHVDALASSLLAREPGPASGALMAVACSPVASDQALRSVVAYLRKADAGSYVLKLVARNLGARPETRSAAREAYNDAEFVRVRE